MAKAALRSSNGLALTVAVAVLLCTLTALAASGAASPAKLHLEAICSAYLSNNVDREEMSRAAQLWMRSVGSAESLDVDSHTDILSDRDIVRKRIDAGQVDLWAATAVEYLSVDRLDQMPPVSTMAPSEHPRGKSRYLILTAQNSGYGNVEALKGKSVLAYTRADQTLCRMWLEVLLQHEHHAGAAEQFFQSLKTALKPSLACLPVFFGKADACVIDDSSWSVLKELNPQIGAQLRVVAESPYLLETLIALKANLSAHREQILHGMSGLSVDAGGRQLLMFFKARACIRIGPQDLAETAQLRAAYLKLAGSEEKRLKPAGAEMRVHVP